MPIDLAILCRDIRPERTAVLFGAGSSIPSGGLTGAELGKRLCEKFRVDYDTSLSLAEIATLVEMRVPRRDMLDFVKSCFGGLHPTRGLLNLPHYKWKDIFSTNYDFLIEEAYRRAKVDLNVFSSNFDFEDDSDPNATSLFKIHGTLDQDRAYGHRSSMILTSEDYELASEYRELVFDRFLHETSRHNILVIGHSLSDPDLNIALNEAAKRKRSSGASGRMYALIFSPDPNRAALLEAKGYNVCFGGLDDFFAALAAAGPAEQFIFDDLGDILSKAPAVRPVTVELRHAIEHEKGNAHQLFNGAPASYGDIESGLVFTRDLAGPIEQQLAATDKPVSNILAPAGFGKTTLARQVASSLVKRGFHVWEHKPDQRLLHDHWIAIAKHCEQNKVNAALFVDDAHIHLRALDPLVDHLSNTNSKYLRLLLASTPAQWHPRTKSPSIFRLGTDHNLRRLSHSELISLLDLFERKKEISDLVERQFAGFSRQEKLRRLLERCQADMFVCLKNIFSFERLDDIILRDYGTLAQELQDVYRTVAAMEASNIRVHRQLVMRVLGVRSEFVKSILERLVGVISEVDVDPSNGIYAWRGRHQVISEIILKYKYHGQEDLFRLYNLVVDHINPSYEIERTTLNELCDPLTGIGRIQDRNQQNFLFRKMISIAPSQRPPRHRLIHNLIKEGDYDAASNEIKIFQKELRRDAPILRFKAMILVERAVSVEGLLPEDRTAILLDARTVIERALEIYPADKGLHRLHCEVGLKVLKYGRKWEVFDDALDKLIRAEKEYLDPELAKLVSRFKLHADGVDRSAI